MFSKQDYQFNKRLARVTVEYPYTNLITVNDLEAGIVDRKAIGTLSFAAVFVTTTLIILNSLKAHTPSNKNC